MKKNKHRLSHDFIAWLALISILILFAVIRYRLLDVPLERDEGEYAYAGQLILEGVFPYQEVFNMKLPGIYVAYALLLSIFGQTHQGIHLGLLIINSFTILLVFLLAKKIIDPFGAIMSAVCFALLSISPSVQGIYANSEHFVILFSSAGLLVMLNALEAKSSGRLFAAGILLGMSVLMKQHGAAFSLFAGVFILIDATRQPSFQFKRLGINLLSFIGGEFVVFGFMCLILVWGGVFENFWFWTVEYASVYVSMISFSKALFYFSDSFLQILPDAPLLWVLIGYGLLLLISKKTTNPNREFILLFFLFSFLSVCPGFYFRRHYFVLMLPCVSLLTGVLISFFTHALRDKFSLRRVYYGAPVFLIIMALFQSIWLHRDFFFHMTPFQVSRMIYGRNPFPESLQVSEFINQNTTKEDCIAILGSEPQIFFYAQRRSASGFIYMYQMMENHPFALNMQKEFIKDIENRNPKYIIFTNISNSWLRESESNTKILDWFRDQLQNNRVRLVGSVELFRDKSIFLWGNDAIQPNSLFTILIFENIKQIS